MSLPGADDHSKFQALCAMTYKEQAVWFLNGYWTEHESAAESVWNYVHKFQVLDLEKGKEGCQLDELNAHRFLESFNETLTVREMRENLRKSGCIEPTERPKGVPLTHFLMFKFELDWHYLIHSAQGDNTEAIKEAQRKLEAVQSAYQAAEEAASQSRQRENEARSAQNEATKSEELAKQRVVEQEAAKRELEAALAEVQREEDIYNNRTKELQDKAENGGVVSRNKAKNELAQHLAGDPLPLRKAKITAEAAVKRAEKAEQAARAAAEQAAADRKAAEEARAAAEQALAECAERVAEAEAFLQAEKAKPGQAQGALWWIERELTEAKKYKPLSKGGIAK